MYICEVDKISTSSFYCYCCWADFFSREFPRTRISRCALCGSMDERRISLITADQRIPTPRSKTDYEDVEDDDVKESICLVDGRICI